MDSISTITVDNDRVRISGVINFLTAASLWEQSLPLISEKNHLNFDFSQVTSANSATLALLLEWIKYAKKEGKKISFHQLPSQLNAIAQIAGLNGLITSELCHY